MTFGVGNMRLDNGFFGWNCVCRWGKRDPQFQFYVKPLCDVTNCCPGWACLGGRHAQPRSPALAPGGRQAYGLQTSRGGVRALRIRMHYCLNKSQEMFGTRENNINNCVVLERLTKPAGKTSYLYV